VNHTAIDIHTHVVPENFPAYSGTSPDIPWPSMAPAHACHRHVIISGDRKSTRLNSSHSSS
jgi:aminocarboxymuconate-semialdehyde decarboxylase